MNLQPGAKAPAVYFKNITSLRFFAALLVFCSHFEIIKKLNGLPAFTHVAFFREAGHLGVVCFFVLSGFLITYLLLREQNDFSRIHVGRFYLRRVLRIWPLYFLILVLGFFVFPMLLSDHSISFHKCERLSFSCLTLLIYFTGVFH